MAKNTWIPSQVTQARLQGDFEKLKAMGRAGGLASAAKRKMLKAKAEREAVEAASRAEQLEDFRKHEQARDLQSHIESGNEHICPID